MHANLTLQKGFSRLLYRYMQYERFHACSVHKPGEKTRRDEAINLLYKLE